MDSVSVSMLMALAGGAGGEVGRQVWSGLTALVRRPFGAHGQVDRSGATELAELEAGPHDRIRAVALREALIRRCRQDMEFADLLAQWQHQADLVFTVGGDVSNTVSGTVHGPVLQAQSFSGSITFGRSAADRTDDESSGPQ